LSGAGTTCRARVSSLEAPGSPFPQRVQL
jgi:hypothetical protein